MTVTLLGRRLPAAATYAAALAACLILLLLLVVGAFWAADQQRAQHAGVRQSFEVRAGMRNLLIALNDAETGQRGYLLTGEEIYLSPYESAKARIPELMDALDQLAEANPHLEADVARVRVLTDQKLAELASTVALAQRGQRAQAMIIVRSDRGKRVMDEARAIMFRVVDDEGVRLETRLTASERGADLLRTIVLVAALMLAVIGVLAVITGRRALAEMRASRDEAQAAHAGLAAEMAHRQQIEAKMLHMQKMEAIGQLTGGVAHDFNNMLAVIMSALTLLKRRLKSADAEMMSLVDGALDGARRAATLTHRLLGFARRAPLAPSIIDVNKLVSGMSDLLRRTLGEQISMETVLAGGLWRTHADASQLENAIVNICVNGRDAMKAGGKLTIETANTFLDEAYAANNLDVAVGQYVMVAITDTGEGMKPDVIVRAFEPFFTTKEVGKGTGLGLSHVHGFLKQTGGHVAIYSEPGVGTTVKLYLPRAQRAEEQALAPAPAHAEVPVGDAATVVLVAEDDDRVRLLSVASLRELGYTVLHAPSGSAALEILAANPGIALLFTDIVMPDMTGRQLADTARARFPQLKVLYTTGYTQNAIVHNGVVDSDARLLMKPYVIEDLARKVRAVLDET